MIMSISIIAGSEAKGGKVRADKWPGDLGLAPVTRRRVADDVREKLETAIREDRLKAGETLPSERDLMAMMGVGRPAVRDALSALARMGLVKISAGGRTRVSTPTPRHLLDELGGVARHLMREPGGALHFERARTIMEVGLVRWVAEHATAKIVDALADALQRNEAAVGKQKRFVETDVAFHRVLAEASANPVLLALHDASVEWLILQRPPLSDPAPNNRMSHAGHVEIFEAIRAHDVEAAAKAMQQHLDEAYIRYARN